MSPPPSFRVQGLACGGNALNEQVYTFMGATPDGRPFYQGQTNAAHYIYFDNKCSSDMPEAAWILGGEPPSLGEMIANARKLGCGFNAIYESRSCLPPVDSVPHLWTVDCGVDTRPMPVTLSVVGSTNIVV